MLGGRQSHLEKFAEQYSYEEITEEETNFLIDLYEVVSGLHKRGEKITLVNIGKLLQIRPQELLDYLSFIVRMQDILDDNG